MMPMQGPSFLEMSLGPPPAFKLWAAAAQTDQRQWSISPKVSGLIFAMMPA